MPKRPDPDRKIKALRKLLKDGLPWPAELEASTAYQRLHDDTDGTDEGKVSVTFSPDGDAWVRTDMHRGPSLRFRTALGGGNSVRVRNALVILALAIKWDSE